MVFATCLMYSVFYRLSKVIRQPYLTDRLVIKLKEKDNVLHCVYLNDLNMAIAAFALQCTEAKNWYDGINKARQIYVKLKQDVENVRILPQQHSFSQPNNYSVADSISIKKSPLGSSIGKYSVPTIMKTLIICGSRLN